jgi:ABC-type phosphate transport system substrate-binding protein
MIIKRLISAALALTITAGIIGGAPLFAATKTLPKIDGSTSTIALDAAFSAAYTGADYDKTLAGIKHSKTFESLEKLIAGEVDIVLSVPISDEQQAAADAAEFNLAKEAVALEGFVFLTNPENPVKSLTEDELRAIYAGEIKNWAEVGGDNAPIYAYQRNLDSGSQTYMNRFMGDTEMFTPPEEWYFGGMGHLVEAVSDYPTSKYAIGYSVYSYAVEELAKQKNLHLVAVNGITPEKATFEDGSYPLLSVSYAYYDGGTATKETLDFIDFMLSDKGQKAAENAGYIPVRNLGAKPYAAKGTGEARPENRIETQKYSFFELYRGNYYDYYTSEEEIAYRGWDREPGWEKEDFDINITLLEGVLANSETEKKINNWILDQYKITGNHGVYYQAINGYMNVFLGASFGDFVYINEPVVVSCWNLKTGEKVENFSDLFYKDSDFVPALNRAIGMYNNNPEFVLCGEPKNFSVSLLSETDLREMLYYYGGDEKEYWYNALGEAYKEMPAWEYFDMTSVFSGSYKENVRDEKVAGWTEQHFTYEKLLEAKIYYSRFLSVDEIERRNMELEKLYDIIEQSEEYKNYDYNTDINSEFDEPIETRISFSEDGNIAYVWTPFGEFTLNSKTGKYKTPSNDFIMKNEVKFIGYIDYDLDGTAETVTLDTSINIYNERWELLFSIPYVKERSPDGYSQYYDYIKIWQVEKISKKEVSGTIVCDEKTFNYTVVNGVPKMGGSGSEIICYLGNENVVYAAEAVDYTDFEYVSGKAKADYNALQKQVKTLKEKTAESDYDAGYFALLTVQNGKRYIVGTSWAENDILYINGMATESEVFPSEFVTVDYYGLYDYDVWRNIYSAYLIFWDSGMQSYEIPVYLGEDDTAIFPVSERGIGQEIGSDIYGITISHQTNDITEDEKYNAANGITQRVSNKNYWFYRSGETLTEYGAVPISLETFKKIKGSDDVLKKISDDKAEIVNILYRANGLVNINCTKIYYYNDKEYLRNINYSVKVWKTSDYNSSTGKDNVTYQISDEPIMRDGVYLTSVLETVGLDNVIYPSEFPE